MADSGKREELRQQFDATRAHLEATSARIEKRAGRNLFKAVGAGLIFAAIFLLSLFLIKEIFALLVAFIAAAGGIELATAFRQAGRRVPRVGVAICGVAIVASAYFFGAGQMLLTLFAAALILTVWRIIEGFSATKVADSTLLSDIFAGLFTLVYVPFLAGFAVLLLLAPKGQWWVFAMVLIAVSVDIGAYAAGVTLGKHKMTPRISPNKTWEGFAGAAFAAVIAGVLISVLALQQPWWVGLLFGLLGLFAATGGDLTESLIKRDLNIKDMSNWLPGHGGLLDRIDSLLPSTVVAYGLALSLGVII